MPHMQANALICALIVYVASRQSAGTIVDGDFSGQRMSNSWAVEVPGGEESADRVATKHGLVNLGQIGSLQDKYTFVRLPNNNKFIDHSPSQSFSHLQYDSTDFINDPEIKSCIHQPLLTVVKKYEPINPMEDPIWKYQWNVNNSGQTNESNLYLDINVIGAWIQGYTGSGVVVGVVDDGVDHEHNDLRANYNSENSYDVLDNDRDPSPPSAEYDHGTSCAGQIAMARSNNVCGIGVAHDSKIAGIRLLGDSYLVDSQEASALSHNRNSIPIYSNSWGPSDAGFIVNGPGPLTQQAFAEGSSMGRNGLGNIFVWAAGNGGLNDDNCGADGFVQSIYTIPVGAYNQDGTPAPFDEPCSAKMTVAYVFNTRNFSLLVPTTTTNNECTNEFTGTSAAAPFVSAITALALEANPDLTWRDVQYLIVYTSNPDPLLKDYSSFENGAGLNVSHHFGFGAIDGEALVTRAQRWINVPEQISEMIVPPVDSGETDYYQSFESTFTYSGRIKFVEHVVITVTLDVTNFTVPINFTEAADLLNRSQSENISFHSFIKRGDFHVSLVSPNKTRSVLLDTRYYDIINTEGYYKWPFTTVLHWGENPAGEWTVTVSWRNYYGEGIGIISYLSATFYGVSQVPEAVANIPDECSSMCARSKGCSGPNPSDCDVCNSDTVRMATTLECIDPADCVAPYQISDGYCYTTVTVNTPTPSSATEITLSIFLVILCYLFVQMY